MVAIHGLNGDAKLPTIIYSRNDNRWMFCFGKLRFGSVHVLARSANSSGDCLPPACYDSVCFLVTFTYLIFINRMNIQILNSKFDRENRFWFDRTSPKSEQNVWYCAKRALGRGDVTTWWAGRQESGDRIRSSCPFPVFTRP